MSHTFKDGLWRLADPKISITSAASMVIGATLAARQGEISWPWLGITALALFCFEVAKNAWGDIYDYDSGTDLAVRPEDRTDFSGGKRVLVESILSRAQTWGIALCFGTTGIVLGLLIVFLREPAVLWLGLVAVPLAWSYHGPPLQLAYRGFGELDVGLCYGPLIATGTYMVLTHTFDPIVVYASLPLGFFIVAFLWLNEFPDFDADRGAGKNNLVVRLGKHRASRLLPVIYLSGLGILLLAVRITDLPSGALLGLVAAIPAAMAVRWVWRDPQTFYRHKPAQAAALIAFVLLAAGISIGV